MFVGSVATGHCKKREKEASLLNDPPVDLCRYSGFKRTPLCTWFWFPWFIAVQKHTVMVEFKTLFSHSLAPLFPVFHSGAPAPVLPLVPTPHSPCAWDTPFIYFLLNFSALRDSFPAVPGGTECTLGVSQELAGVETHARGQKLGVASGCWRGMDQLSGSAQNLLNYHDAANVQK